MLEMLKIKQWWLVGWWFRVLNLSVKSCAVLSKVQRIKGHTISK